MFQLLGLMVCLHIETEQSLRDFVAHMDKHKGRLLTCLDWLEMQLSPLLVDPHTHLDDPELEHVVLRTVARR